LAPRSDAPAAGEPTALGVLAELVGGTLEGDAATCVCGMAGLDDAGAEHLSFCALPEYRHRVAGTEATAVIVARSFVTPPGTRSDLALIRVDNPYLAVAAAVRHFFPETKPDEAIHRTAVIDATAELGQGVSVGARAVIGPDCRVGSNTRIGAGCVLAEATVVGADCRLYPNVTIYSHVTLGDRVILHAGVVLGADGFGYATDGGRQVKIPQVGGVVLESDVEVGANSCIDRGALGDTRVERGTKIDNLVQIGHNCEIGPDSVLSGHVGLGGSTIIGKGVMIGGQAGLSGHIEIGDGVMIAAGTGVISSVPAATRVAGYPQMDLSRWRRAMVAVKALPDLVRRVRRLEAADTEREKEDD
jgi:UDP-3-O-[3-hydroxymyristoyl] glucosamine N-acyltransferase